MWFTNQNLIVIAFYFFPSIVICSYFPLFYLLHLDWIYFLLLFVSTKSFYMESIFIFIKFLLLSTSISTPTVLMTIFSDKQIIEKLLQSSVRQAWHTVTTEIFMRYRNFSKIILSYQVYQSLLFQQIITPEI